MFSSINSIKYLSFVLVILTSILSTSIFVGNMMGNFILGVAVLIYALVSEKKLVSSRLFLLTVFIIFIWYGILLIVGKGQPSELLRLGSYLAIGLVCLFLIPSEIRFQYFAHTYAWIIGATVIIGLLTKLGLSVTILNSEISTTPSAYHTYYFVGEIISGEAIQSVFTNPNTFGPFAFFGAILALYLYSRYKFTRYAVLLALNFVGIYFSRSRSAMLAFLVAITIYIIYMVGWSRLVNLCSIGTIPGILTVSAVGGGLLPDPLFITDVTSNRVELWRGSVQALFNNHLFGTGPVSSAEAIEPFVPESQQGMSSHNAFLAMFATGGLITGTAYAFLFFYIHLEQVKKIDSVFPVTLVGLTVGAAFLQLFEAYLIFGYTNLSVVTALSLGYAHQFIIGRWPKKREDTGTPQRETESLLEEISFK